MKTNLLREHLKPVIEAYCNNVSYGEYEPDMDMPYTVFKIDDINVSDREDKQLEINIYSTDVNELEHITDGIGQKFKNYKFINDDFLVFTKVNARTSFDDDKNFIRRRRLLIDLYFYDRSVD